MSVREFLSTIADKVGISSIAATVGITTAKEAELIASSAEWGMTDYGLMISIIVSVLFGIEKILSIYEKIKAIKKVDNQS